MRFITSPYRWILGAALLLLVGGFLLAPATGRADQPVVTPTTQWVNFVSTDSTFLGRGLIVGDRVDIYDAQGVLCGSRIISVAGTLPVTPCYGDDPATPEDEGAEPGDILSFRINGLLADGEASSVDAQPVPPGTLVRWQLPYALYEVTLGVESIRIYLPLLTNYTGADLTVESLTVQGNEVQVIVRNRGSQPVVDEFWVDLYIDPGPLPVTVNQSWDLLGQQGAVWGVTGEALPLAPGQTITLRLSSQDPYFYPDYSVLPSTLAVGQSLFVQVDSYNEETSYGGVLENHESANQNSSGGQTEGYNNITDAFVLAAPVDLHGVGMQVTPQQFLSGEQRELR